MECPAGGTCSYCWQQCVALHDVSTFVRTQYTVPQDSLQEADFLTTGVLLLCRVYWSDTQYHAECTGQTFSTMQSVLVRHSVPCRVYWSDTQYRAECTGLTFSTSSSLTLVSPYSWTVLFGQLRDCTRGSAPDQQSSLQTLHTHTAVTLLNVLDSLQLTG